VPRRVLLLAFQLLLGESLATLLDQAPGVEVNGPWQLEGGRIPEAALASADVVVLAGDPGERSPLAELVVGILDRFPDLPVVRVTLDQEPIRLYRCLRFPSGSESLIDLLATLSTRA